MLHTDVNVPICCPSRASMWSGRQPHTVPHMHNDLAVRGAWNNYEGVSLRRVVVSTKSFHFHSTVAVCATAFDCAQLWPCVLPLSLARNCDHVRHRFQLRTTVAMCVGYICCCRVIRSLERESHLPPCDLVHSPARRLDFVPCTHSFACTCTPT